VAFVQPRGVAACNGVEHEERPAAVAGGRFRRLEQRCTDPLPPCATVHEHLGQICPVRLIFGKVEQQLHGAADAVPIVGDEEYPFAGADAARHAPPECERAIPREGMHEADRRSTFDAIDQNVGQRLDRWVVDRA
jgi:hypothetical protein